jgi:hypothetical protein
MIGRAAYDSNGGHPAGTRQWGRATGNNTLIDAAYPLQHWDPNAGQMGLDLSFSDDWVAANPDTPLVFMPGANGGTGFSNTAWRVGFSRYNDAVTRLNLLFAENPGFVLGGFLWHQGEQDQAMASATYEGYLDAMIAGLRSDVTAAGGATPFVLGQTAPDWHTGNAGRLAILAVIDDTPNRVAYTAVVSSAGLTTTDNTHFDAASLRTLGSGYYTKLLVAAAHAPSAPDQVTGAATVAADTKALVTWTTPGTTLTPVTGYQIERQASGGSWATVAADTGLVLRYVDTGITNGTTYGYRVSALSAAGTGTASATVTAVPVALDLTFGGSVTVVQFNDLSSLVEVDGVGVATVANTAAGANALSNYTQATSAARFTAETDGGVRYLKSDANAATQQFMDQDAAYATVEGHHYFILQKQISGAPSSTRVLLGHSSGTQIGFSNATMRAVRTPTAAWANSLSAASGRVEDEWGVFEALLLASGTSYLAYDGVTKDTTTDAVGSTVLANRLMSFGGTIGCNAGLNFLVKFDASTALSAGNRTALLNELNVRAAQLGGA